MIRIIDSSGFVPKMQILCFVSWDIIWRLSNINYYLTLECKSFLVQVLIFLGQNLQMGLVAGSHSSLSIWAHVGITKTVSELTKFLQLWDKEEFQEELCHPGNTSIHPFILQIAGCAHSCRSPVQVWMVVGVMVGAERWGQAQPSLFLLSILG